MLPASQRGARRADPKTHAHARLDLHLRLPARYGVEAARKRVGAQGPEQALSAIRVRTSEGGRLGSERNRSTNVGPPGGPP